jgi:hypothetical protein
MRKYKEYNNCEIMKFYNEKENKFNSFHISNSTKIRLLYCMNKNGKKDGKSRLDDNYFDIAFTRVIHHLMINNDNNSRFPFNNGFIQ